ncbi:MAG: capsule assembly Wzi family protein [Steroidobacteraceae bacterium]
MASWIKALGVGVALVCLLGSLNEPAWAAGVSAYLPLNLEPEIERQIERVLILADEPVLKRPFAVELVKLALPQACKIDKPLCTKVQRYLERYEHDYAVTHGSATAALKHGADVVVPNEYGLPSTSAWEASAQAYVQPSDYLLASGGVVAYSGRTNPTGTVLSLGFNWAQLDLGYRDHWLSPATDSSMLLSTEAPTMPSVTLSNYEPLTRLGFQYEFFWARMSQTGSNSGDSLPGYNIDYNGVLSRGNPHLFVTQLSIEPFPGWSLGVNRLLQYGGGSGLPDSAHFVVDSFFKPSGQVQTESNTQASYVSRFIFPGKTPFAVYFQYAGEVNLDGGSYLLGDAALTAGIDFPRIWRHFDLTYEVSEWQNLWYVHNIFLDGTTNDGIVEGNWGAQERVFGDGVGARSQMIRVGWEPPFGGYLEERVRSLVNQEYHGGDSRVYEGIPGYPYHHYLDFTLRYSRPWNGVTVGGEVLAGRDIDGHSFSRLAGFVRYGGDAHSRDDGSLDEDSYAGGPNEHGAEVFVDVGVNANQLHINVQPELPSITTSLGFGPHFGLGARRAVSERNDLGVRLEADGDVNGHSLLGVRVVDYRHRYSQHFAVSLFAGVARYDVATPAYSMYGGLGAQWRNILPKWDLGLDLRYAQNVARDRVLASDPPGTRPEIFYKIETALFYLSRRF